MARRLTSYFCTECGNETPRWAGQCPACGDWNTLAEEPRRPSAAADARREKGPHRTDPPPVPRPLDEAAAAADVRRDTGIQELDFVLGGGLVAGSIVLIGGEPGIGKSTLILQAAASLQGSGFPVLYVSGEESPAQIRLRADRLGRGAGKVPFIAETDVDRILAAGEVAPPGLLLVDSIQTVQSAELDGAPGNVGQVRECAARFRRFAKERGVAVVLVGHVTKGGVVAGPRTLEHIVDTVLYFEAAEGLDHRILRATKNRFGAVDEVGVFRMTATGLQAVANPSELFLSQRRATVSGSAVTATIEGSRSLLAEVQALCHVSSYPSPQRVVGGFDRQRLALLLAVLEKRAGVLFGEFDVFVNVVGGVRLREPAADLAIVAAVLSSAVDRPYPAHAVFVGEVGLGGELRAVGQMERRLGEAARLGFRTAFIPDVGVPRELPADLEVAPLRDVAALRAALGS